MIMISVHIVCICLFVGHFPKGALSQTNDQLQSKGGGQPFDPNKLMKQFMQMRTDQNAFGSYNPLDVKEAVKVYFQKGDQVGHASQYGNLIAALSGFDPNGQSMFAGQQSEIWKFSSNYNPNKNLHKYVSESTDVGSLGSIKTPEGGLHQGAESHANGQINGGLNQGMTDQSHTDNKFNANTLNSHLMTVIDKQTFRPGIGSPSTFSSSVSFIGIPGVPTQHLSGATPGEASFNPNHLNHELFQTLGYNPDVVNSETTVIQQSLLTGSGGSSANANGLSSGPAASLISHQNGGTGVHGALTQDGGTTQNHATIINSVETSNQNGGLPTIGNGETLPQNGGNVLAGGNQNSGTGAQISGTATLKPYNGGTLTQNSGTTQTGGSSYQNGGKETSGGGTTTQTGGTHVGNGVPGNGGNGGGTTDQPRYHIVLNSKGEHVLVQETDTPGKFVVLKTISNEKLANYLIGKLSSANPGSAVPKSLSVFLSAQLSPTQTLQPKQPIVEASPLKDRYTGGEASQQSEALGTGPVLATGIGELGGGQVGQLPNVSGIGSLVIDQVNTNPYVSATGIGTLGSDTLTQGQESGMMYSSGMEGLGDSGRQTNGSGRA